MNSRATNGPLLVLMAIAFEADEKGECVMSVAELARKARLSDRAVRSSVGELTRLGELEVLSGGSGRGHRTAYRLTVKAAESATFEPETRQNLPPLSLGNPAESATFEESNPAESATFSGHVESSPQVSEGNPAESATFTVSDVLIGTNGRSVVEVKDVSEAAPATPERPDVDRLCDHLAARITANGSRPPRITRKWRDAARLLIDADGMTEQQVHTAIDWCQDHEFWRSNILSMPKLREKYDQLRQQARRAPKPVNGHGDQKIAIIRDFIATEGARE